MNCTKNGESLLRRDRSWLERYHDYKIFWRNSRIKNTSWKNSCEFFDVQVLNSFLQKLLNYPFVFQTLMIFIFHEFMKVFLLKFFTVLIFNCPIFEIFMFKFWMCLDHCPRLSWASLFYVTRMGIDSVHRLICSIHDLQNFHLFGLKLEYFLRFAHKANKV